LQISTSASEVPQLPQVSVLATAIIVADFSLPARALQLMTKASCGFSKRVGAVYLFVSVERCDFL
jgi:hypothetical protein